MDTNPFEIEKKKRLTILNQSVFKNESLDDKAIKMARTAKVVLKSARENTNGSLKILIAPVYLPTVSRTLKIRITII